MSALVLQVPPGLLQCGCVSAGSAGPGGSEGAGDHHGGAALQTGDALAQHLHPMVKARPRLLPPPGHGGKKQFWP